jgi:hypothetical protein
MRQFLATLFLILLSAPATAAPTAECSLVNLDVMEGQSTLSRNYLQCFIREESARTVIRESQMPAMAVYDGTKLKAWEFTGAEIDCAARTSSAADMADEATLRRNLDSAEAVCRYYINPENGQLEKPVVITDESSAGVSNHF